MRLHRVQLHSHVFWGICPEDPRTFLLDCIPGASLLNPFVYESLRQQVDRMREGFIKPTFIDGSRYHVVTDGFWIAVDEARSKLDWNCWHTTDLLERLVQWLRYASKQFTLMPRILMYETLGCEVAQLPDPSLPVKGDLAFTSRYHLTTSLTCEDLKLVSRRDLAKLPPTYDTMLLGAMQALQSANYGWATVLSGVAIEHVARQRIRPEAKKQLGAQSESKLRNARIKDLLHKLRVDLSLSSLHYENPMLYQQALEVHGQRSDILHGNVTSDDRDWTTFRLSARAVQCAIDVFRWFGEPGRYESPVSRNGATVNRALPSE